MQQSGGQIAAEHTEPPGGGEDRLSALPDDVLVLILQCLDTTAEAAQTSVLARRWRKLWLLLPKLRFHLRPDGNRIRELLDVPDAPQLRYISVTTKGAAASSATAWRNAAAGRLAGGLFYGIDDESDDDDEDAGDVQLPCFENATTIELCSLGLVLPSLGVFTRLTDLSLSFDHFRGPCDLGNIVSSPRCPCLQRLSICYCSGLGNIYIHSESLLQIELRTCDLSQVTVVTPILQKLSVYDSFPAIAGDLSEPVANITAPQIVSLAWKDLYVPGYFHLSNLGQLRELQTRLFCVYGTQWHREYNSHCLRLLQRFQVLHSLHLRLVLVYDKDISDCQYLLQDITMLPRITFLQLELCNDGHAFGASLFHLLRMCIGIRKLSFVHINFEEELACPSDCICGQSKNWKTDELVLGHLEDVHITGLQGAKHEIAFVQQLLSWATVLKSLRITLDNKMTEGKIMEFREALAGFSRLETCIQFDTSDIKQETGAPDRPKKL